MSSRYYKFSRYLINRYGEKVWKVSVDAGFSCPHKNKSSGKGGCIFCRIDSFSQARSLKPITEQIRESIALARKKGIKKYIVYFQASTNTYAPIAELERHFACALNFDGVVGLSIATRPDCLSDEVIVLLKNLTKRTDVWIELGLQSIHDKTLCLLHRGHTYEDYLNALHRLKAIPVRICAHLMFGLPGEDRSDEHETAIEVSRSGIHEVKCHPLLVLKDTPLADLFHQGQFESLSLERYIASVCDFIEIIPPDMVVQRLTAEAPQDILLAPKWALNKLFVLNGIEAELKRRDSNQGCTLDRRKG
jgi:radical SAM protein (TIGR01212 family)